MKHVNGYRIKDLPNNERPIERILEFGAEYLTDSELLAIILNIGGKEESVVDLSKKILIEFNGFKGLSKASIEHLISIKNIGRAKAARIKATCEIASRLNINSEQMPALIKSPKDVYKIIRKDVYGKEKEHLFLISLDTRNRYISKDLLSIGTINEAVLHPREVFKQAMLRNASSIILVHNHPSQDTTPSAEDISLTNEILYLGKTLGISLLDHLVVSNSEFSSIKALGLLEVGKLKRGEVIM